MNRLLGVDRLLTFCAKAGTAAGTTATAAGTTATTNPTNATTATAATAAVEAGADRMLEMLGDRRAVTGVRCLSGLMIPNSRARVGAT